MKTITLIPGSAEWLKSRSASKASAMMGASKYQTRTELLSQMATGITKEVDAGTQARFDNGHCTEALARVITEEELDDGLSPISGATDDGYLTANFDGLTFDGLTGWEHKDWNEELAATVRAGDLPSSHYWQLEQQILVGSLVRVIFTVSDGTREKRVSMEYRPIPGRAEKLLSGWRQFDEDLANYQHVEVIPAAVASPQMALPALAIQVNGSITLTDNLAIFGDRLKSYVEAINKKPETDQDFADLESTIKTLKTAEEALDAAESNALGQTASIDEMRRTVGLYRDLARQNRLVVEKLVKAEKENRRNAIILAGKQALAERVAGMNDSLGIACVSVVADFAGSVKGLKSLASIQSTVSDELARATIEANGIADRVRINLRTMGELAKDHAFLFPDTAQIILKPNGDCMDTIKVRIAEHKEAEAKRLEAERAKIRAEEEVRAAAKAKTEQEAIEAQRKASEPTPATTNTTAGLASASANEGIGETPALSQRETLQSASVVLSDKAVADASARAFVDSIDNGATIKLGEICVLLGFTVSADFLSVLGFQAKTEKNAKLYREASFPAICAAIVGHVQTVANTDTRSAA